MGSAALKSPQRFAAPRHHRPPRRPAQSNRDLADSLLTGTDVSSKLSTDELLALIQG